jgi:ribosome maturation factor RimP
MADLSKIEEVSRRVAASYGLEVVEVEMLGGGKARRLRITIDRPGSVSRPGEPGGVTMDDCANVSREVSTILDVEDAVPGDEYTLEVSSPGLDRKLTRPADFERFVGSRMKVMTREPVGNNRHFDGRLEKFETGTLTLDLSVKQKKKPKPGAPPAPGKVEIALDNVEKANLVPEI